MIEHQSSFSRSLSNVAKKGAYYTDVAHCRDIGKLLAFPKDAHVDVLEPSSGDASAVLAVTEKGREESHIHLYCVELDNDVSRIVSQNPLVEKCVCEDFLEGVRFKFRTNSERFSFIFGNPPYIEDKEEGVTERMEHKFLRSATTLLSIGGVIAWVIPLRIYAMDKSVRFILANYDVKYLFRFRESEYRKWGQIVMIGVKKERTDVDAAKIIEYQKTLVEDAVPVLPSDGTLAPVEIPCNEKNSLVIFEKKLFDYADAFRGFKEHQQEIIGDAKRFQMKHLCVPKFRSSTLRDPLVTLCDGHIAQAIAAGEGQGLTGTPGVDEHLQRGVCEIVEEVSVSTDEEEEGGESAVRKTSTGAIQKVTTSSSIKMTVINASGSIVHLM